MAWRPPAKRSESTSRIEQLRTNAVNWGFQIERRFPNANATRYLKLGTKRGSVYCTTKEYAYQGQASFPLRIVHHGIDTNTPIAIFFNDPELGNAYVFRPRDVLANGFKNRPDGTFQPEDEWVDIPLEHGTLFGDWLSNHTA